MTLEFLVMVAIGAVIFLPTMIVWEILTSDKEDDDK